MYGFNKLLESDNIYYIKMNYKLLYDYLKMYTDSDIQESLFKKEYSKKEIHNWINNKIISDSELNISMIEKDNNAYIGDINVEFRDEGTCEISICITPEMQGKGYGLESMNAIIEYVFNKYDVSKIELYVKNDNEKAISLYKKVGFEESKDKESNSDSTYMTRKR